MGEAVLVLAADPRGGEPPDRRPSDRPSSNGPGPADPRGPDARLAEDLLVSAVRLQEVTAGAGAWAPADLLATLDRLDRTAGLLSVALAELLLAVQETGAWQGQGDRSFE